MVTKSTAPAASTDTGSLQRALDNLRAGLQVIGFDPRDGNDRAETSHDPW
jgi:hypothetical protein